MRRRGLGRIADPRCRSGKRCVARTSEGAAVTSRRNTLCAACIQDLQRQLDELPHLAAALRIFLGVTPKTALQSRVKSSPEPACPIDPRVDELLVDISDVIERTDGLRVADLVTQPAAKFQVWHRDRVCDKYLEGWQRAVDIRGVHMRADAILGFKRIAVKRHAPCPDCGLPALQQWIGDPTIECEECGLVMSLDEYDQYCNDLAKDSK